MEWNIKITKDGIVPAAGGIYFAQLDQKLWRMHFDSEVIQKTKTHQNAGGKAYLAMLGEMNPSCVSD